MDVFPTVVKAAELELFEQACDGVDLLQYLKKQSKEEPHTWLCWENRNWSKVASRPDCIPHVRVHNQAIRKGNWKLVRYFVDIDSEDALPFWQLYDLSKDISESNDIAQQHPRIVEELSGIHQEWHASMLPSLQEKR